SQYCEYPEKIAAVPIMAAQMAQLAYVTGPDIAFVGASKGPCSSMWTAANGSLSYQNIAAGEEERFLLATTLSSNPAVGPIALQDGEYDQGISEVADSIILRSGI
ncbi:MAG: hypothetical protein WCB85_10775, partial [Candidatus Dormiibacterota bacterium]